MAINQINVNRKAGLTFAAGLRSILRADPDIIMVGEIRDAETARIAIESALTGHMVLSTLHTNDAPGTITRLAKMGIESVPDRVGARLRRRPAPRPQAVHALQAAHAALPGGAQRGRASASAPTSRPTSRSAARAATTPATGAGSASSR